MDSEFAPGEDARPPDNVAGVAENLPASQEQTTFPNRRTGD